MGQQGQGDQDEVQGDVDKAEGKVRRRQQEDDDASIDGVEEQDPSEHGAEDAADVVDAPHTAGAAPTAEFAATEAESTTLTRITSASVLRALTQAGAKRLHDHGRRGVAFRVRYSFAGQE